MKPYIRTIIVAAIFAAASFAQTLHAQTGTIVKVNVPFAFDCGSRHFGPGTYTLNLLNMDTLLVRDGRDAALAMINPEFSLKPVKSGYAVFSRYGDQYFLEEIWMPGSTTHIAVYERKWEKRAAQELVREGTEPTHVELALLDVSESTNR